MHPSTKTNAHLHRGGFALIMALGLMALVVLLAMALSALINVESSASRNSLMLALARQNAKAALYQAVGVLQKEAGRDNAVTARAEILGGSVAHPLWTGVWSGTNSAAAPVWLVSGRRNSSGVLTSSNPQTPFPSSTQTVSIRGTVSADSEYARLHNSHSGQVIVERMELATGDTHNSGYAWWISDEGVKASAALMSDTLTASVSASRSDDLTDADIRRARQFAPLRAGLEDAFSEINASAESVESLGQEKLRQISRISDARSLSHVDANRFFAETSPKINYLADDLTGMSYGVLADTTAPTGSISLKTDLSTALLNTWTWKKDGSNQTISRLENPSIAMPPARSDWDAWAPALSAYLNIWKVATIQSGTSSAGAQIYEFPLTAPVAYPPSAPGSRPSPTHGTPVFSVAPVLSEFIFTFASYPYDQVGNVPAKWPSSNPGAAFTKGKCPALKYDSGGALVASSMPCSANQAMFCTTSEHVHTVESLGFDSVPMGFRCFSASEYWNPYTTDILMPVRGKLQLRIRGLPSLTLSFYQRSPLSTLTAWNGGGMSWTWHSDTPAIDLQEIYESGNTQVNGYATIDMNRPARMLIASNSFRLYGGETVPWSGWMPKGSSMWVGTGRMLATYGIKDEQTFDTKSNGGKRESWAIPNFHSIALCNAVSVSGALCPVIERDHESNPVVGNYRALSQQEFTRRNTRVRFQSTKAPTFEFELWYIPASASDVALNSEATFLSSYKAQGSRLDEGKDGQDTRSSNWARLSAYSLQGRAGWFFLRRDAYDTTSGFNWLASGGTTAPNDLRQDENANLFKEGDEPGAVYMTLENQNMWREADRFQLLSKKDGRISTASGVFCDTLLTQAAQSELLSASQARAFWLPERDLSSAAPVFELPTRRPVSLGNLQHLSLAGRRPFAIGNSWGYNLAQNGADANAVFDKFYLSGLAPVSTTSTDISSVLSDIDLTAPMLNAALVPLWSRGNAPTFTDSTDILAHFLSKGAFNINSTSVTAWKAMLSGLWLNEWEYADQSAFAGAGVGRGATATSPKTLTASENTETLERAFFRYPHTASQVYTAPQYSNAGYGDDSYNTDADYARDSRVQPNHFRRGVRKLSSAQVEAMAESVVDEIRARGRPFVSMAEFLAPSGGGKSVLERAIEHAGVNDDTGSIDGELSGAPQEGSSAYLTQADLLNTLAPVLQARSDTFKVRAYGDVRNAQGQVEAKAVCEAIVQRYPDVVENDGGTVQVPGAMGRQFRIVSVKWVNE